MATAAWRKDLRALTRRRPTAGEETKMISEGIYNTESDRAAALIAGTFAENSLEAMIRIRLVNLSAEKMEELFGVEGSLGRFSDKIRIAYAFGVIDPMVRNDLDRIREIRNTFAHSLVPVHFLTPSVEQACAGFHAVLPKFMTDPNDANKPREKYVGTAMMIVNMASAAEDWQERGHTQKIKRPFSYDASLPWLYKFLLRSLRQTQKNPPEANKKTVREAPP